MYVVKGDDGEVLFRGPKHTVFLGTSQLQPLMDDEDAVITTSHEGTLVMVYFAGGAWHISTKSKLNAYDSMWADLSTSFGADFEHVFRKKTSRTTPLKWLFEAYFKHDEQYLFLLKPSPRERVVLPSLGDEDADRLLYVGRVSHVDQFSEEQITTIPISMSKRHRTFDFDDDDVLQNQGFHVRSHGVNYKIYRDEYRRMVALRGNTASLVSLYFSIKIGDMPLYKSLYPEVDTQRVDAQFEVLLDELTRHFIWTHYMFLRCESRAISIVHHIYTAMANDVHRDAYTHTPRDRIRRIISETVSGSDIYNLVRNLSVFK